MATIKITKADVLSISPWSEQEANAAENQSYLDDVKVVLIQYQTLISKRKCWGLAKDNSLSSPHHTHHTLKQCWVRVLAVNFNCTEWDIPQVLLFRTIDDHVKFMS